MKTSNLAKAGIAVALAGGIAAILFAFTFERQITGFFRIGDVLPLSPFIKAESARVVQNEVGYDGQLFLTIALDPALRHSGTIAALDNPKYRYRRIGYPIAGYLLGFGNQNLIPYAMVGVNIACVVALVLIISALRNLSFKEDRLSPFSLMVLAIPGAWVTICLSTSDLLGTTLLAATFLLLKSNRNILASLALCGACLTRETYLATAFCFAVFMLLQRKTRAAVPFLLCTIPALCWLAFVMLNVQAGTAGVNENFSIPGAGIVEKLRCIVRYDTSSAAIFEGYCFILLISAAALLGLSIICSIKNLDIVHVAAMPLIAILSISKMQILVYHANYLRIFLDVWLIILLLPESKWFSLSRKIIFFFSGIASAAYVANYIIS